MREVVSRPNDRARTHGHSSDGTGKGSGRKPTPMYRTWQHMRQRCANPKHHAFKDYGGRGITVCERWRIFENFLADMGERPEGKSLDRINNDLGYSPDNCRWATTAEQNRNQRKRVRIDEYTTEELRAELARRGAKPANGLSVTAAVVNWQP